MDISKYMGKVISVHKDADGIASGVLLGEVLKPSRVLFPEVFGDYTGNPDIMADMKPIDSQYKGLVIDHHGNYPEDKQYELITGSKPASLLVYELLKDKIPVNHHWKVVAGIVGDAQPSMTPIEIIEKNDELFYTTDKIYVSYGSMKIYHNPIWFLLSGGINDACRCGKPELAYNVLKSANTPMDVMSDIALIGCSEDVDKEEKAMKEDFIPFTIKNKVTVWHINSGYGIESLLATKLFAETHTTILVINERNKKLSIRGILCDYIRVKLADMAEIGGHLGGDGYFGGSIKPNIKSSEFLDKLKSVL